MDSQVATGEWLWRNKSIDKYSEETNHLINSRVEGEVEDSGPIDESECTGHGDQTDH